MAANLWVEAQAKAKLRAQSKAKARPSQSQWNELFPIVSRFSTCINFVWDTPLHFPSDPPQNLKTRRVASFIFSFKPLFWPSHRWSCVGGRKGGEKAQGGVWSRGLRYRALGHFDCPAKSVIQRWCAYVYMIYTPCVGVNPHDVLVNS